MTCVSEAKLERIVLDGDQDRVKYAVELEHIRNCNFCQARYDSIQNFYQMISSEYEEISSEKIDNLLKRVVLKSFRGSNYSLSMLPHIQLPSYNTHEEETRLAASSTVSEADNVMLNRGVFTCSDGDLGIRVIEDRNAETITLYLISPHPEKISEVLVSIPGQGIERISDESGKIILKKNEISISEDLVINISTPKANFDLKKSFPDLLKLVDQGEIELSNESADKIQFDISTSDDQFALRIVLDRIENVKDSQKLRISVSKGYKWLLQSSQLGEGITFEGIEDLKQLKVRIF